MPGAVCGFDEATGAAELLLPSAVPWLRAVFDAIAEGVVVHARDGRILDANPAAERLLGLSRDQILGRTPHDPAWQTVDEDGTPFPRDAHPAAVTLRTGASVRGHVMGVRVAGKPDRWISINTEPVRETAGACLTAVVATFVDVTEQRQSTAELHRARMDLEAIVDNVPARVTAWDLDYTNLFANRHAERAWNLPHGGASGRKAAEILGAARFERALPCIDTALGGTAASHEQADPQPDGSVRHSLVTYVPRVRDGRVVGVFALGVDVTALRQAQQELTTTVAELQSTTASLRASEHRLRTVANGVPMAIALFDHSQRIVFANAQVKQLAPGGPAVEGRLASEFFPPDLYERGRDARARAMQGEVVRFEVSSGEGGERRTREVTYAPYRAADGRIEGVFALGYDVTEIHQSRERVRQMVLRLAEAREGEKLAISTTLHEGIAQELFAARLGLQQIATDVASNPRVRALATEVSGALEQTVGELRRVTNELVPISLANLPLPTTLRIYAEDFAARHGLKLRFELGDGSPDARFDLRLLLFRTLQQGLAEAQERAGTTTVIVGLDRDSGMLQLTVADDGRAAGGAATGAPATHGVLVLAESFRALGGEVRVQAGRGAGTVLTARLPSPAFPGTPEGSGPAAR
jgi:PAS domain S-box-containing protein